MHKEPTTHLRIGESAAELGLSPRMARYLEEQGVLKPDRGPDDRGHRHYPPTELELARVATEALKAGVSIDGLAAVRRLAEHRAEVAFAEPDPLARFELLAIARATERLTHPRGPGGPHGSHGPDAPHGPDGPHEPPHPPLPRASRTP